MAAIFWLAFLSYDLSAKASHAKNIQLYLE
jgi:hypothetical protein